VILTSDGMIVYQTTGVELLLRILTGEPGDYTRHVPVRDKLPAPILKLLGQITGAANGTSNTPPRMRISSAYRVLTLEAKWLVPAGALPEDAARDPKSCLIAVTMELHEHPCPCGARAARKRRDAGPGESRHSTCFGQDQAGDRGRARNPTLFDRGCDQKALSESRCSQFRRASHKNLAEPKTRRGPPKFAARGVNCALIAPLAPRSVEPQWFKLSKKAPLALAAKMCEMAPKASDDPSLNASGRRWIKFIAAASIA
jgi:hypothetical protein